MEENLALDAYGAKDIVKLLKYGDELVKERKAEI